MKNIISKKDNGDIVKICKVCHIEKEINGFYKAVVNGKTYYKNECKVCYNDNRKDKYRRPYIKKIKGNPIPINKNGLTDEIREFLNKIEQQRGYIDMVDSYRLTSYYIEVFGCEFNYEMDIKIELEWYYNKLLELM